jgi:hypothetical protein
MNSTILNVVAPDCADPGVVARFWAAVKERPMRIKIISGLLAPAVLATTLGGCMASATGQQSGAKSGTEHFWVSGFSPKTLSRPTVIVATGLFTESGKLVGKGPIDKGAIFDIDFSNGTIVANKWHKAHFGYQVNASTCLVTLTASGSVIFERGTGAYTGISGTLSIGGDAYAVLPRLKSGKCNETPSAVPLGIVGMLSGSGKVTISG